MNKLIRILPRWIRRLFRIYGTGRAPLYTIDNCGLTVDLSEVNSDE